MKKKVKSLSFVWRPDCYDSNGQLIKGFSCDKCYYENSLFCLDVDKYDWKE